MLCSRAHLIGFGFLAIFLARMAHMGCEKSSRVGALVTFVFPKKMKVLTPRCANGFLRIHQQRWWGQSAHHQLRLLRFGWSNPNSYSTIACLTIHTRKWVDVTRILQFSWEFKGDPRPASHPPQRNKALLEQVACWSGIPIHWTQINPFIY